MFFFSIFFVFSLIFLRFCGFLDLSGLPPNTHTEATLKLSLRGVFVKAPTRYPYLNDIIRMSLCLFARWTVALLLLNGKCF